MKTIVLFFVLLAAFAAVAAKHNKKQKAQENQDPEDATTHDWPQPETVEEYGVPEGYDGPATSGGQSPGGPGGPGGHLPGGPGTPGGHGPGSNDDLSSGKSHVRSSRRHN